MSCACQLVIKENDDDDDDDDDDVYMKSKLNVKIRYDSNLDL